MGVITAAQAAQITGGQWQGVPCGDLYAWGIDSRKLQPGMVFVALRTAQRDGADYLEAARAAGAVAAIVQGAARPVDLPQLVVEDSLAALQALAAAQRAAFRGPVCAITGSFGKTGTKDTLAHVLGANVHRTHGNYNNHIGLPLTLLGLDNGLHQMAVVEIGINAPGEMAQLAALARPSSAIVTGVGAAHLERLGNLDGVAREKAQLLAALPEGARAYFPAELTRWKPFCGHGTRLRVTVTCRKGDSAALEAALANGYRIFDYDWIDTTDGGAAGYVAITTPAATATLPCRLPSAGQASNLALVAAFCADRGFPGEAIAEQLHGLEPGTYRGQAVQRAEREYYVDCYNANPDSMRDSAAAFRRLYRERSRLYILGEMGELGAESARLHREVGAQLGAADRSGYVLVGPGAAAYREGLLSAGVAADRIRHVALPSGATPLLESFTGAVFVKGSRHLGLESLIPGGMD